MVSKLAQATWFKFLMIATILIIPFIYSFFYLRAYWNPYGPGNIDNIPVAIVNQDTGTKGESLVEGIKNSGKLKPEQVSLDAARQGLDDGTYYALIDIPTDFTADLESAATANKHHPTITYSPNQKSNYFASQIISSVILGVEKDLDNKANSAIIGELSDNLQAVPSQLQTISTGLGELKSGANQLEAGATKLKSGADTLSQKYQQFNAGLGSVKSGADTLSQSTSELHTALGQYAAGVNQAIAASQELAATCEQAAQTSNPTLLQYCAAGSAQLAANLQKLDATPFAAAAGKINTGAQTLAGGTAELYQNSQDVSSALASLSQGASSLRSGVILLDTNLGSARTTLNDHIATAETKAQNLDGLSDYSKNPVNVDTAPVYPVPNYGVAFAPFFISISLWVGCLILFVVLYYDKDKRFGFLGLDSQKPIQRNLAYYGLATISAVALGVLLQLTLPLDITHPFLFYVTLILVANCFLAIVAFCIETFGDFGKFVVLILLVLQLAASGGTFPIQTVDAGLRFLNPLLPMTYTIELLRGAIVSPEATVFAGNLTVVIVIFCVFFALNLALDVYRQRKLKA